MSYFILDREFAIRLGFFLGILVIMAVWEMVSPRRVLTSSKKLRWFSNLGISLVDTLFVRLLLSITAVGMALFVEKHQWGLLNNLELPGWTETAFGVMSLDFAVYLQHVLFHAVPAFWRLHMVHHSDMDFDVTTGVRFHPIEILLSMGIKIGVVAVMGASAMAVLIFEVILNADSMFNHGNVRIPASLDKILRFFIVTPEMHRIHHSVVTEETNSNFGFNLTWWDRFLGTYRSEPVGGHEGMIIGLNQFRNPKRLTLPWLLILPFIGRTSTCPMSESNETQIPNTPLT
jgi:sterol desaturase/sphingolipid hydroxylase (fatty acid hydroxylase superfamily)